MTERRRHENEGNRGMEAWRDKRVAGWVHVEVAVTRESVRRRNLLAQEGPETARALRVLSYSFAINAKE